MLGLGCVGLIVVAVAVFGAMVWHRPNPNHAFILGLVRSLPAGGSWGAVAR
jgi:hypothetical protein